MKNIGKRFGNRVVIGVGTARLYGYGNTTNKKTYRAKTYLCVCDCGLKSEVLWATLKKGKSRCINCANSSKSRIRKFCIGDMVGDRLILDDNFLKTNKDGSVSRLYKTKCKCGKVEGIRELVLFNNLRLQCSSCYFMEIRVKSVAAVSRDVSIGDKFGEWTVIKKFVTKTGKSSKYRNVCRCSCGTILMIVNKDLLNGWTKSCLECLKKRISSCRKRKRSVKKTKKRK